MTESQRPDDDRENDDRESARDPRADGPGVSAGQRARARRRAGLRVAVRRAWTRVKTVLLSEPDQVAADPAEIAAARERAASAGALRGGVAKLAQLAGYTHGPGAAIEVDARAALGSLWDAAPPEAADAVAAVIRADLGAAPESVFAAWSAEPLAAASLGQVHAARGPDGADLAVKVQYPGVADALRADLASPALVRELATGAVGGGADDDALARLRDAVLAEVDYRREAEAMEAFAAAFADEADVIVPEVAHALSSARVLTMTRVRGATLAAVFARDAAASIDISGDISGDVSGDISGDVQDPAAAQTRLAPEVRDAAGAIIWRFSWLGPLRHGLLHADPNPGNFAIADTEPVRVAFLDYGCAARLDPETRAADAALWRAALHRDPFESAERFRHALHDMGLVASARVFHQTDYRAWEARVVAPLAAGTFAWTPDHARALSEITARLIQTGALRMPGPMLLLWRQRLGIAAVLGALGARFAGRAAVADAVDATPASRA